MAVHCHNDFGLAVANTIAAITAGAEVADTVTNGLGDRAGNAAFEEVVCILEVLYKIKTGIKIEKLYELSKLVEKLYGIRIPESKAIIGINCYRHSTDDHISSLLRGEWMAFENIKPEVLGRKRSLEFGPMALQTGPDSAIATKIEIMGLEYTMDDVEKIADKISKKLSQEKKFATEEEVEEIIKDTIIGG
jgi:isopropylmalate/homocitrate/citramalate synthase